MSYRGLIISLIVCIFSLSNPAFSQNLASEQQKLRATQQSITDIQHEQKELEDALSAEKSKISKFEVDLAPSAKARDEAKAAVDETVAAAVASPTTENSARVKNAEFKMALAERKYNKSSADLQKSLKTVEELNSRYGENQKKIRRLNKDIEEQQKHIVWLESNQQKVAQQEAEKLKQAELKHKEDELIQNKIALAESQAEQAAAEQEIVRLKAMLDQQSAGKSSGAALAGAAVAGGVVVGATNTASGATSVAAPTATTAPSLSASSSTSTKNKATQTPADTSSKTVDTGTSGSNTSNNAEPTPEQIKALAQKEHAAFALRASQVSAKKKRSATSKIFHVQAVDNDATSKSYSMSYAGKRLYSTEIRVNAGKQLFKFGQRKWDITIPPTDDKTLYVVNYDILDKNNPRLVIYKKSYVE